MLIQYLPTQSKPTVKQHKLSSNGIFLAAREKAIREFKPIIQNSQIKSKQKAKQQGYNSFIRTISTGSSLKFHQIVMLSFKCGKKQTEPRKHKENENPESTKETKDTEDVWAEA